MNRIQRCALFTLLLAAVGIPAAQAQNSFAEDTTRNAPPAQRAPGQAQRPPQQYPAQQYPQAPGNAQPWQNQPAQPPPGQPWQGQPPPWQAPGGPQNPPPQPG